MIRIPTELYNKVQKMLSESDGVYSSVPDYIRKSIGEKLINDRKKTIPFKKDSKHMRTKGEPDKPGTKTTEQVDDDGPGRGYLFNPNDYK